MTTTGEHLVSISTLATGTALEHFLNISTGGGGTVVVGDLELELGEPLTAAVGDGELVGVVDDGLELETDSGFDIEIGDDGVTGETC